MHLLARRPVAIGTSPDSNQGLVARKEDGTGESRSSTPSEVFARATADGGTEIPFRDQMERAFGQDFSGVKAHLGQAGPMSEISALAATQGQSIAFASSSPGVRLVAHELAHVVQNRSHGGNQVAAKSGLTDPGDASEREADAIADRVAAGASVAGAQGDTSCGCATCCGARTSDGLVQRAPDGGFVAAPAAGATPNIPPPVVVVLEGFADQPMANLLDSIRTLPSSLTVQDGLDKSGLLGKGRNRIRAALYVVKNERIAAAARIPEELAEMRELLAAGSKDDRDTCEAQFKDAAVPTAPTVPSTGLPPAPAGHPQAGWPKPLLEAIHISLADRYAGMPGSRENLANGFGGRPADLWAALTLMGSAADAIKQVYDRWAGSGIPWSHLRSIRNAWSGSSTGFRFNGDVSSLRKALEGSTAFCKDKNGGDLYHDFFEGTAPCWRECVASNTPGLHFCVGGVVPTVHIDPHQVIEERESDGTCNYDMSAVHQHFKDLGWLPSWL